MGQQETQALQPLPAEAVSEFCAPADKAKPGVVARVMKALRIVMLRYQISSTERYLALCAREGITTGEMLTFWRIELGAMRVQLRRLQGGAA